MIISNSPTSGTQSVAKGVNTLQRLVFIEDAAFGTEVIVPGDPRVLQAKGLPNLRVQLMLYPTWATGTSTYQARNYISWRVLGLIPSNAPPAYPGLVNPGPNIPPFTPTAGVFAPLTPPKLLPVGVPVYLNLNCSVTSFFVEFDTTSQNPTINNGIDAVLLSLTASA